MARSLAIKRAPLSTRPPLDRMQQIFQAIKSGGFPNRTQLAVDIEVTTKTIQRDLDFMRDRMSLPIAYDAVNRGYAFTQAVTNFPMVELSEAEIVSVFIAQKALAAHRGTPFEQPLRSAYAKLISGLNGRISVPWADLGNGVSFRTYQASLTDLAVFEAMGNAVRASKVVCFDYKKLGSSHYTKRRVEPYHVASVQGQWYAIAFDLDRNDWRNFALGRMRNVEALAESFERNRAFDINIYLRESLGIFRGEGMHSIRLEFDAWAAELVRERAWHPAQEILELAEGRIEFSIRLSSFEEIVPWILSWGEHVRVLQPVELKNRLRKTIAAMQGNL
ncbi:MAG: WYL domain-containing protein [Terrimicrobiaceae bacterium]|nr:WYL domain-containing protein [Terrimicrobiaceae bacterium]